MALDATINISTTAVENVVLSASPLNVSLSSTVNASLTPSVNPRLAISIHENFTRATQFLPIVGLNADEGNAIGSISGEPISTAHFFLTADRSTITVDNISVTTDQPRI